MPIDGKEVNLVVAACGFVRISTGLAATIAEYTNELTTDRNEAAMFLAQLIHESGGFRYKQEINGQNQAYAPYYGRGFIQLTWEHNYRAASEDLYGDYRLIREPDLLCESDSASMVVSVWFWNKCVRPAGGPSWNNFGLTTKAINGVLEPNSNHPTARKRYALYRKAATTLGVQHMATNIY